MPQDPHLYVRTTLVLSSFIAFIDKLLTKILLCFVRKVVADPCPGKGPSRPTGESLSVVPVQAPVVPF